MYLKWKKEEEEIKRIDHRKGDGGEENKRDFWSSTSSSSSSYQEFAFFLGPYLAEEGPAAEIRNRFGDHSKIIESRVGSSSAVYSAPLSMGGGGLTANIYILRSDESKRVGEI